MEGGTGSLPLPLYRGNKFPGRCCPNYNYEGKPHLLYIKLFNISHTFVDIDECGERNGLCSDVCINDDYSYQCGCAPGRTLSNDGLNCGGKPAAESSTRNALVFVSFTLLTQVLALALHHLLLSVCYRSGQQFLFGDRVKVGCNWWYVTGSDGD